ncbi:TPA: ATP-binding domain-containing protein, partial [Enterococcus faecium]|nr:ATP-binding domain-containing protein [Enterococcus faecium]
ELGYASTIHRAQGMTADTAHVLADAATSRELAYVGLTRGREANHLYVETGEAQPVRDVLDQIAGNADGMLSATETIRAEQARVDDLVTLVDQYADVADRANTLRFEKVADQALGDDTAEALREHESWGAVEGALRHAEAQGLDPADVLYQSWTERDMEGAEDRPAVLSARIMKNTTEHVDALPYDRQTEEPAVPSWIADRRAIDSPHTDPAWREHMAERYDYLQTRLEERGAALAVEQPEWTGQLGQVPAEPVKREEWTQLAAEVDVFRQRYGVDTAEPTAIPDQYREQAVGADLARRVTALHKSTQLSTQPVATDADRQRAATSAATTAQRARDAVTTTTAATAAGTSQDARKAAMREQMRQAGLIGTKRTPAGTGTEDGSAAAAKRQQEQQAAQRRAAQQRDRDSDRGGYER